MEQPCSVHCRLPPPIAAHVGWGFDFWMAKNARCLVRAEHGLEAQQCTSHTPPHSPTAPPLHPLTTAWQRSPMRRRFNSLTSCSERQGLRRGCTEGSTASRRGQLCHFDRSCSHPSGISSLSGDGRDEPTRKIRCSNISAKTTHSFEISTLSESREPPISHRNKSTSPGDVGLG